MDKKGKYAVSGLASLAKAKNLVIHPYTLRSDQLPKGLGFEELAKLLYFQVGVDGIFTDFGDKLAKVLAQSEEQ